MSSLRILIADCTPSSMQAEFGCFGAQTNAELFETALSLHQPDLHCASVNIADGDALWQLITIGDVDRRAMEIRLVQTECGFEKFCIGLGTEAPELRLH